MAEIEIRAFDVGSGTIGDGALGLEAAQGKFDESIDLYQRSIAIIPFPLYVEELGAQIDKLPHTVLFGGPPGP